jgi:hypothetical protein
MSADAVPAGPLKSVSALTAKPVSHPTCGRCPVSLSSDASENSSARRLSTQSTRVSVRTSSDTSQLSRPLAARIHSARQRSSELQLGLRAGQSMSFC